MSDVNTDGHSDRASHRASEGREPRPGAGRQDSWLLFLASLKIPDLKTSQHLHPFA